jgi:hypothetical protein
MWIMLMQTTAAKGPATGQGSACTSSASGAATLPSPAAATRVRITGSNAASASVGCQASAGSAAAKCATCCPVPEAISSTRPLALSSVRNTSRIGPLLRSEAAATGSASPGALNSRPC